MEPLKFVSPRISHFRMLSAITPTRHLHVNDKSNQSAVLAGPPFLQQDTSTTSHKIQWDTLLS